MSSSKCILRMAVGFLLSSLILLMSYTAYGGLVVLNCPETITADQRIVAPEGWTVIVDPAVFYIESVMFFSGHPSEKASLVPDKTYEENGQSIDHWSFVRVPEEKIWIGCTYSGTKSILAKPIEDHFMACDVRYETTRAKSRLRLATVTCKCSELTGKALSGSK